LAHGGWRLVFTEREAVVFVRETDANRPLLTRVAGLPRGGVPGRWAEAGEHGARPTAAVAVDAAVATGERVR
jgi:hypothetical protein